MKVSLPLTIYSGANSAISQMNSTVTVSANLASDWRAVRSDESRSALSRMTLSSAGRIGGLFARHVDGEFAQILVSPALIPFGLDGISCAYEAGAGLEGSVMAGFASLMLLSQSLKLTRRGDSNPTHDAMAIPLSDMVETDKQYAEAVEIFEGLLKEDRHYLRFLGCNDPASFSLMDVLGDTLVVRCTRSFMFGGEAYPFLKMILIDMKAETGTIVHELNHILDLRMELRESVPKAFLQYAVYNLEDMIARLDVLKHLSYIRLVKGVIADLERQISDTDDVELNFELRQAIAMYVRLRHFALTKRIEAVGSHFDAHPVFRKKFKPRRPRVSLAMLKTLAWPGMWFSGCWRHNSSFRNMMAYSSDTLYWNCLNEGYFNSFLRDWGG